MFKFTTKKIASAGIIACLYVVLSLITFPIASSAVQFRASECLTLLPLIFPEAVSAIFIGCLISNLITGCAVYDVLLGSIITLIAGMCTFIVGKCSLNTSLKIVLGGIFPILLNAFLLPLIWLLCYKTGEYVYILQVAILAVSQSISVYLLGTLLIVAIKKFKIKR